MRVFSVLIVIACSAVPLACAPSSSDESIDAVLEAMVEEDHIPGVIAMAANANGVIYSGAFGQRDLAAGEDMSLDSIVRIASMTKPITSVAAMQLVERGEIELDRAAADYVARLRDVQVLEGFDADGKPVLRAPASPVTVRQLLTHTAGFAYEFFNADAARAVEVGAIASAFEPGDAFLAAPLMFDPGTAWEYGINTDWVGVLVETVSGQTLDEYFRQHIFEPLGMRDTYFDLPEEKQPRLAVAYTRSTDGALNAMPPPAPNAFFSGGGGLVSTAPDYMRFLRALLNGGILDGVRILEAETVDLMARNHIGELEAAAAIRSLAPQLSNDVNLLPGSIDKFGLGFLVNTEPVPGGRAAGSLAWAGIFNTYFWVDPSQDVCAVLMTQLLPFYDADVVAYLERFERSVYRHVSSE